MAFAWLPKAAVQVRLYFKSVCCNVYTRSSLMQAAIGPVFLDNARKFNKPEWEPMGREILTLAVWNHIITLCSL